MLVEEGSFAKLRLFYEYQEMCREQGIKPTTNSAFGKLVHTAFPGVQCNRKGPRGNAKHHYKNLAPRTNGAGDNTSSHKRSRKDFDYDDEEDVEEEDGGESEEESDVEDSSDSSSDEDSDDVDERNESRPGSVVGNPLSASSDSTMTPMLPIEQQQQPASSQFQFVPVAPASYMPPNENSAQQQQPQYVAQPTDYASMQPVVQQPVRMAVPRALHSAVARKNPYGSMIAHAPRPQPVYSAGCPPTAYFQPIQQQQQTQAPSGPVPVIAATTNSPFVPYNAPVVSTTVVNQSPVISTIQPITYPVAAPAYIPTACPAALEVPLMDELTFDGWQTIEEEEDDAGASYFKPLVNTESYALLRFKQQQRRRKQRRSQFLFQQIEQLQEQKDRECISPSADVDHSVALDDDFWNWVSEFVSKEENNSAAVPVAAPQASVDASAVPNEWETDFGNANDLERFLNNP
jgi:hypothetical protein